MPLRMPSHSSWIARIAVLGTLTVWFLGVRAPVRGQVTALLPRSLTNSRAADAGDQAKDPLEKIFPGLRAGAQYVGAAACLECHREPDPENPRPLHKLYAASTRITDENRRGCEGCHGPGSEHIAGRWGRITNPARLSPELQEALCMSCHEVEVKIGYATDHFEGHSTRQVSCLACHEVHAPATRGFLRLEPNRLCAGCHADVAAQFTMRSRHPLIMEGVRSTFSNREGKVGCLDCHQSGASIEGFPDQDVRSGVCLQCHPDSRGPFLFPHDAGGREVSEGCVTCHMPHGSPGRHLLRANERSLCVMCHTDQVVGHFPAPSCTTIGCHTQIHGSNRSAFLLRS